MRDIDNTAHSGANRRMVARRNTNTPRTIQLEIVMSRCDNQSMKNPTSVITGKTPKPGRKKAQMQISEEVAGENTPNVWAVQCSKCDKWRRIPLICENKVPADWECRMNVSDTTRNTCDDDERQIKKTNTKKNTAPPRYTNPSPPWKPSTYERELDEKVVQNELELERLGLIKKETTVPDAKRQR